MPALKGIIRVHAHAHAHIQIDLHLNDFVVIMDLKSRVQILEDAGCISIYANDLERGMNPFLRNPEIWKNNRTV